MLRPDGQLQDNRRVRRLGLRAEVLRRARRQPALQPGRLCADFLAQRRSAAVLFDKLEVKRAFQAKAAARSDVFVQIAMDFRVYAKQRLHPLRVCFLSTGKCRFDNRPEKPCQNFPCAQKLTPFVSTRLDKLQ